VIVATSLRSGGNRFVTNNHKLSSTSVSEKNFKIDRIFTLLCFAFTDLYASDGILQFVKYVFLNCIDQALFVACGSVEHEYYHGEATAVMFQT